MKVRKLIGLIAVIVLGAVSIGTLFGLSRTTVNDIAGFDFKTVNEANYFKVDLYRLTESSGAPFDISDDGEITMKLRESDVPPSNALNIPVQIVTLDEGEYVFKSGVRKTSKDTYCLVLREYDESADADVEDGDVIYSDDTFKVASETTYMLYFYIAAGETCDGVTFTPILVDKGEKASFYVYDFNPFNNED